MEALAQPLKLVRQPLRCLPLRASAIWLPPCAPPTHHRAWQSGKPSPSLWTTRTPCGRSTRTTWCAQGAGHGCGGSGTCRAGMLRPRYAHLGPPLPAAAFAAPLVPMHVTPGMAPCFLLRGASGNAPSAAPRTILSHPTPAAVLSFAAQVAVERYIYFPSSRASLGLKGPSLLDAQRQGLAGFARCLLLGAGKRRLQQPGMQAATVDAWTCTGMHARCDWPATEQGGVTACLFAAGMSIRSRVC